MYILLDLFCEDCRELFHYCKTCKQNQITKELLNCNIEMWCFCRVLDLSRNSFGLALYFKYTTFPRMRIDGALAS